MNRLHLISFLLYYRFPLFYTPLILIELGAILLFWLDYIDVISFAIILDGCLILSILEPLIFEHLMKLLVNKKAEYVIDRILQQTEYNELFDCKKLPLIEKLMIIKWLMVKYNVKQIDMLLEVVTKSG